VSDSPHISIPDLSSNITQVEPILSPIKVQTENLVGFDSTEDDSFSPVRLSPLKALIYDRPQNPTPDRALSGVIGDYELPEKTLPKTPEYEGGVTDNTFSSSPFQENVSLPESVRNMTPMSTSKSPKRRLSYIEVPQAGEDGPLTPPAKRLMENIEAVPDTVTRRRYGRRASMDLLSMASDPMVEDLKARVRGYLIRKRITAWKLESSVVEESQTGSHGTSSGSGYDSELFDRFLQKRDELSRSGQKKTQPASKVGFIL
jgi:hypothetical protein